MDPLFVFLLRRQSGAGSVFRRLISSLDGGDVVKDRAEGIPLGACKGIQQAALFGGGEVCLQVCRPPQYRK